jgi:site-specific recombinase XerD
MKGDFEMADRIVFHELEESMIRLKSKVLSDVSAPRLASTYAKVIDGFVQFCRQNTKDSLSLSEAVAHYYEHVTKVKPFSKPDTKYLKKLARAVFMIRDTVAGRLPAKKYNYNVREIPHIFTDDIRHYENWLIENNNTQGTIQTRIGRIKRFLFGIHDAGCTNLTALTPNVFIAFVGGLTDRYASMGKNNILYTIRNYFSCPHIKRQLKFDPSPFLMNLHTNKHGRLSSCYTPEEIRKVLDAVDRSSAKGKMYYLMMLLAGLYGLRSYDIRTIEFANIDWKRKVIILNQHKTGRYIELPLIQEVFLAMLDYVKNVRPKTTDPHIFIRQRSPHVPYSNNNHFAPKIAAYFKEAGIITANKHSGLHSMRHSFATALLKDNVPINDIANILGHTSPQTTTAYIWSDIEQLRNAALEVIPYAE